MAGDPIKLQPQSYCHTCGVTDTDYDNGASKHDHTSKKHVCNEILEAVVKTKNMFTGNRQGAVMSCTVQSSYGSLNKCIKPHTQISAKPGEEILFRLHFENESNKQHLTISLIEMSHDQPEFQLIDTHGIIGSELAPKSKATNDVVVSFSSNKISTYCMPIAVRFTPTFKNEKKGMDFTIIRRLMVFVEEALYNHEKSNNSPFKAEYVHSDVLHRAPKTNDLICPVPAELKPILASNLTQVDKDNQHLVAKVREIFDTKVTENNYLEFFKHLLWYEEVFQKISLKKYNKSGVTLQKADCHLKLEVPGLSEKRPSLLKGDTIFIINTEKEGFAGVIVNISENTVVIGKLWKPFVDRFNKQDKFDVRFVMSRASLERMHLSIQKMSQCKNRLFPQNNQNIPPLISIDQFYNQSVRNNAEQRSAVEQIVSNSSGRAPYLVFGPPGTGKTVTIVEAILQIVKKAERNRVLVCTDSNMAADHIACALLKYEEHTGVDQLLFRVNSQCRPWNCLPEQLVPYSNGHSEDSYNSVCAEFLSQYRIVIATLSHSFIYEELRVSHLFIDEAAQASEPACLIPMTSLLLPEGQLVLAGDPQQLGPVCVSRRAAAYGLGQSLMERLTKLYPMYKTENEIDSNYITMLVKNFRSHEDILRLPNQLFYNGKLQPCAPRDSLSYTDILTGNPDSSRAVMFHAVISKEEREGKAPSFFNRKEIEIVEKYVKVLINIHHVRPEDIGIITPYQRQMCKIRDRMKQLSLNVDVGTVEAFQGQERRVIIISTVRANCNMLVHDAKYNLGFLVDDKRFNVAITRAKVKVIVVGSAEVLCRDEKWRRYMSLCDEFDTAFGGKQTARDEQMLRELAHNKFDRWGIIEQMKAMKLKQAADSVKPIRRKQPTF